MRDSLEWLEWLEWFFCFSDGWLNGQLKNALVCDEVAGSITIFFKS